MRALFIFDPVRNTVLLIADDKSDRRKEWLAEAARPVPGVRLLDHEVVGPAVQSGMFLNRD